MSNCISHSCVFVFVFVLLTTLGNGEGGRATICEECGSVNVGCAGSHQQSMRQHLRNQIQGVVKRHKDTRNGQMTQKQIQRAIKDIKKGVIKDTFTNTWRLHSKQDHLRQIKHTSSNNHIGEKTTLQDGAR